MQSKILSSYLIQLFGLTLGLFFASGVLAATPANIIVNMAPQNPAPYETTTISLSSYAYNIDTVMVTWLVDGRVVSSGIGKKSFAVTAGASGSTTTVVAKMDFPDGATETRVVIRPGVMVLLWEATDSYTPPFYKGKALAGLESSVKIVAIPEVKSGASYVDSKNMTYSWKKDYSSNQSASGYGKNYFLYIGDYLDGLNHISVVASTADGQSTSTSEIIVGTVSPQISFYKKDPKFGILWENTIENGHRIVGEEVLIAAPYFIIPNNLHVPSLVFDWYINTDPVVVQSFQKNILPVRVDEGVTGTSQIRLDINSTDRIFQTASKEISVGF